MEKKINYNESESGTEIQINAQNPKIIIQKLIILV